MRRNLMTHHLTPVGTVVLARVSDLFIQDANEPSLCTKQWNVMIFCETNTFQPFNKKVRNTLSQIKGIEKVTTFIRCFCNQTQRHTLSPSKFSTYITDSGKDPRMLSSVIGIVAYQSSRTFVYKVINQLFVVEELCVSVEMFVIVCHLILDSRFVSCFLEF